MCSCDSGAYPEFQSWAYPRARKEYRCHECGVGIHVGERHEAYSSKWEGDVNTVRVCAVCVRLRSAYDEMKDDPHCNPPFGELRSCIRESVDDRFFTWKDFLAVVRKTKHIRELRAA